MRTAARLMILLTTLVLLPALAVADSSSPSVAISSPQPGLTIATDSVPVSAAFTASEGADITQVELLVDGIVVEVRDLDPPQASGSISFTWSASAYPDGSHRLSVRATDAQGGLAASGIRVLLRRTPDLDSAVRIQSPASGQTVSGLAPVRIDLAQSAAVKYVIFLVDDVFKALNNIPPFTYLWDTTRYLNGIHRLQAKVYLSGGGEALSAPIEVRVDNPGGATMMQTPQPPAAAPEPVLPPARAAQPTLPPPMHTESPSSPEPTIQTAGAEVATPGTAPFVSPTGELVVPPVPVAPETTPAITSLEVAALPSAAAEQPTPPAAAAAVASLPPQPAQAVPAVPAAAAPAAPSPPPPSQVQVAMLPPPPAEALPEPRVVPAPVAPTALYTVQPSDCLWSIAARFGVPPARLAQVNDLADPSLIHPGQQLRVPSALVYCNGRPLAADVQPIIADGRAIVPLRAVVESAGGAVTWEQASRQAAAALNDHSMTVTIGSPAVQVDGKTAAMASPAVLIADRTFVPLRFLGDAFELGLAYRDGAVHIASAR